MDFFFKNLEFDYKLNWAPKGKHKIVELSSNAVYVDGKFKGSRDILRDVTEKKKTTDSLQLYSSTINSQQF